MYCLFLSLSGLVGQETKEDFVVVLDAGHGGKDTGNRGNGYYEKHIALNITKMIGAKLQKQKGIKVIFTRKDDRFIELKKEQESLIKPMQIYLSLFTATPLPPQKPMALELLY